MKEPDPIDFPKIIAEIISAGITPYTLSKMMRRHHTQLKRWRQGSQPRHYEGVMLLMIHSEYAGTTAPSSSTQT